MSIALSPLIPHGLSLSLIPQRLQPPFSRRGFCLSFRRFPEDGAIG
ncbi:hypothetical protein GCWU000341_00315 [Oribacterium sp. oral taxon 078 str. F0262]|nr:hypothetical protein GCWU000341_00315 [Oribacterium sp. oral taxon 078 str. F0262]